MQIFSRTGGRSSSRIVRMRDGMTRRTRPTGAALLEDRAAEPAEVGDLVRGVDLEVGLEPLLLPGRT
jgi:hypothetical protein